MVLPPQDKKDNYFLKMQNLNNSLNLRELSMGMSSDYLDALKYGATTFVLVLVFLDQETRLYINKSLSLYLITITSYLF